MSKVEGNQEKEYVALNVVQQWVYLLDDKFEVRFFHKSYPELDCLLKRYDRKLIWRSWSSYPDCEYKEDQISID